MSEQQIWFLLIFSVPFVPAIVVFLFIRPRDGDAHVGGSLPILKDLRLDLGGAIATYLVIVVLGIIAYLFITQHEAVAFEIPLLTPDGVPIDPKQVEWANVQSPKIVIKLVHGTTAATHVFDDFSLHAEQKRFVSRTPLYFSSALIGQPASFEIASNASTMGDLEEAPLQPIMTLSMRLKDRVLADWLVRIDHISFNFNTDDKKLLIKRLWVLTNVGKGAHDRVQFGPWSVEGLQGLMFRVFKVSQTSVLSALEKIETLRGSDAANAARTAALEEAENSLFKDASEIGNVRWDRGPGEERVGYALGTDAAKLYVAPLPRIDSIPGGLESGQSLVALIDATATIPETWRDEVPPIVALYSFLTDQVFVDVSSSGAQELCETPFDIQIDAPDGQQSLDRSKVTRTSKSIFLWTSALEKDTKLVVPIRWKTSGC